MATTEVTVSFHGLSRELQIPEERIQAVVQLLDAGNTVPFITRYRKDQTGGLDEQQIRTIQNRVTKLRQLAERKQAILRAIEAQNKLTPTLAKKILAANSLKRLDDLYLPFRPKKQTLATIARERGLGHLAEEILNADPICADLDKRAADYVNPDKQILSGADALLGAGHILAEMFSENAALRARLRDILKKTGVIKTVRIAPEVSATPQQPSPAGQSPTPSPATELPTPASESSVVQAVTTPPEEQTAAAGSSLASEPASETAATEPDQTGSIPTEAAPGETEDLPLAGSREGMERPSEAASPAGETEQRLEAQASEHPNAENTETGEAAPIAESPSGPAEVQQPTDAMPPAASSGESSQQAATATSPPTNAAKTPNPRAAAKEAEKRRKEEQRIKEFADYFDFQEAIRSIPPHRVLAINRGEALKIIRVKIKADEEALDRAVEEICVPKDHPHADFLRGCARDALNRLILPSLEREIRRELTEKAEAHAVKVFAKNLRRLLLQRPVRDRRVLAIDPGYRNGCKLAALDEYGNVLDHKLIYLVEKKGYTREMAKETVCELIDKYQLTCIAIGNGSGSRLAEMFIAELLENELKNRGIGYTIVNEAGASVYSTSQIGREELPNLEASYRGAVSIGRRLLDPLSELVKIDPANLGVGMYQHDLKEKHLRESLDEVVESCVNYVGVDVNTASPALLGYVSGLNKLTARRIYEYRQEHGAFRSREELKKVPGIGEATFVQAAGFLKISGGDNPLDATWIHPESYELAHRVMEKLGITAEDLTKADKRAELAARINQVNVEALAAELNCGVFTLRDILAQFVRPGRDPREELPPPVFKQGILKLEDLSPGMELMGTVLNVVDFGAFVDIGLPNSGLVHRSRMDRNFVADPHSVVAVGDVVRVWVVDVDRDRRRISLSLVPLEELAEKQVSRERRAERTAEKPRRQKAEKPRRTAATPSDETEAQKREESAEGQRERRARFPRREDRPARPEESVAKSQDGMPVISRPVRLPRRPEREQPKAPAEPLSEEVLTGKEPMRSFADLMQYFAAKGVIRPSTPKTSGSHSGRSGKKNKGGKDKKGGRSSEDRRTPEQAAPSPADRLGDQPKPAESPSPTDHQQREQPTNEGTSIPNAPAQSQDTITGNPRNQGVESAGTIPVPDEGQVPGPDAIAPAEEAGSSEGENQQKSSDGP